MKKLLVLAITALSACAATAQSVTPLPQALCAGWQGQRTCELLHEDAEIRVLRCTFPPGVGHEAHYHPPHFGYSIDGEGVMRITSAAGVEDRQIRAGSSFANETEVRHEAINVGEQTIRYLIVEKKYADTRAPDAVAPGLCPR